MKTIKTNRERDFHDGESIFALAPVPMRIFDLKNFKSLPVNQEAVRQFDYPKKEFSSKTINKIGPAEDISKVKTATQKTRSEFYKKNVFRHRKKDGDIISARIKGNLITYKGRNAKHLTATDLTEIHQAQQNVQRQKLSLEIIEQINDTLLKSGDWIPALDHCFEIIGKTLKVDRIYFFQNDPEKEITSQRLEWTGKTIASQIDNPDLQNISFSEFPVFMGPLRNGKIFEAIVSELPLSSTKQILQEQEIRSLIVVPVISDDSFIGFIGMDDCTVERKWAVEETQVIRSLTTNIAHLIARKTTQTELINNEYKFRTIIQKSSDLIAIIDKQGIYRYVNDSSTEVLGIPPEEFIGKNVSDYIHSEDLPKIEESLEQVLHQDVISTPPFRFPDASGKYRWLKTTLTNLIDDPVISGIVANSREITLEMERKMEKELLDSISRVIRQPASLKECLSQALLKLLSLPNICLAEAWIKSQDESRLDLRAFRSNTLKNKSFYTLSPEDSFIFGDGLPGYTWKRKKVVLWGDLSRHQRFRRRNAAKLVGLQAAISVPIMYNDEFLGSFILFSQQSINKLTEVEKLLKEIGDQLGAVVKQKITEEEYRAFFEISPDPHCIIGFDGYIKKYNHAFTQLLGYEKHTLLNKKISSFIHEEDKAKAVQNIKSSVANQSTGSFTTRFITKNGQTKWLFWSVTALNEAKIFIAAAKDITEQRITEQELKKTYNRFKKAQKIASLGYWTKEIDSDISEWSEETYHIFGYTPENFIPTMQNVRMVFHPDDRYYIEENTYEDLIPNKIQSFEHRIIKASGEVRWVRQEIQLLLDEKGCPKSKEGTIRDITETKENEERLKVSNERFRLAMKASNEMIWEIDHNKNIVTRGTGHEDLIDYNLSEPYNIRDSWCSKIYPEDIQRVWDTFHHTLRDPNKSYWREEYRVLSENGTIFSFIDRCYISRNDAGHPIRSVGSVLDVTLSRQHLERIRFQNENLKEIAWLQSHVVRAPLSKIMGLIGLAKDYDGGGISYEDIFEMISTSAQELDNVIREITHKTEKIE